MPHTAAAGYARKSHSAISTRRCLADGEVPGEPYTNAARVRLAVVARRACWAAAPITTAASRCAWGPYDFKPYSRDGKGFDWPISYEDLAPYYDKAEELIGVFGTHEGLENTPDGKFQPAPAPRGYEKADQGRFRQTEYPLYPFAPGNSYAGR